MKFLYAVAFLGGIVGGLLLFGSLLAESAPQQGAGAAMAVAFVVIPYCMARAMDKLFQEPLDKTLGKILTAQQQPARPAQQEPPAQARNPFAPKP